MGFDAKYKTQDYNSVGTRPVRPDGVDKVTGRARYGADFNMPGQLVGRVLRSPHAHARIVSIDTSGAERLKGVKAVFFTPPPVSSGLLWKSSSHTTEKFLTLPVVPAACLSRVPNSWSGITVPAPKG